MCGRFVQLPLFTAAEAPWPELADELMQMTAKYNLAPTQRAAVVLGEGDTLEVRKMRWGLVPHWAKAMGKYATHNARIETVTTLRTYRDAWKKRRCLIPMAGYFEWVDAGGKKNPYFLAREDGQQLYAAGLWEPPNEHLRPEDEGSCTMIVQDAQGPAGEVHDRMPVFLDPALARDWMTAAPDDAMAMLLSAPMPELAPTRVTRAVNSTRNQGGPEFLEPSDD